MTTTAQYLKKALESLVNRAFDPAAKMSSADEYEDILPEYRHNAYPPELDDNDMKRRVEEAFQAEDKPALKEGDHAGIEFLEDSSHIKDIVHGVECPGLCNAKHTEWLDADVVPGFIKYWVTWAFTPGFLGKGTEIPEYLHESPRRSLLMQNLCEWAVIILFQCVKDVVKLLDPHAQVYQIVVAPRRRFQLMKDSGTIAGTHSLFLICSPLAGDFVLDPTAEQYGIPREKRILPWSVYKQLYVVDKAQFLGAAVWSIDFEPYMSSLQRSGAWDFWKSVGDVLQTQTAAWLEGCDLKAEMDDESRWKAKEERLESSVKEGLSNVKPGPET